MSTSLGKRALAEFIGTFFLVLFGTAAAVMVGVSDLAGTLVGGLVIALAFGLGIMAMVSVFGVVSGAHINPAVTVALITDRGRMPMRDSLVYVAAQLAGALAASFTLLVAVGTKVAGQTYLGAPYPAPGVSQLTACFVETVATFALMLAIMSQTRDVRADRASLGPTVGAVMTVAVLVFGPLTGAAMNPARALAPMFVTGNFTAFWVYIVGPVAGAVLAAVAYRKLFENTEMPL